MLGTSASFPVVLSTENELRILLVYRLRCIESPHNEGRCLHDSRGPTHNCCNPYIREDKQHWPQPKLVVVMVTSLVVLADNGVGECGLTIDSLFLSATFADLGISVPSRTNLPSCPQRSASRKQLSVFVLQFVCHCMHRKGKR